MNRYQLKRDVFRFTGLTAYRWHTLKPGVYVFNYHRIGNAESTPFDPNVFSCDEAHFAEQIATLRNRFRIISVKELIELIEDDESPRELLAMITFDDGYRDNYTAAFPVLKATRTPAVFFLPTSYIGAAVIPWWDEIAWLLKNTQRDRLLGPDWLGVISLDQRNPKLAIRRVLTAFKRSNSDVDHKLEQLREATNSELPAAEAKHLFMTWDDVRSMHRAGMDIGSHTHSHQILSHLSADTQRKELLQSKSILEQQIDNEILSLAYPVGGPSTYTKQTQELVKECGYRVAFSFISGFNPRPVLRRFELLRMGVEDNANAADIRFSTAFCSVDFKALPGLHHGERLLKRISTMSRARVQ